MCGEKERYDNLEKDYLGSPPHVRGKEAQSQDWKPEIGITPACAGKRCADACACPAWWDHPRMCGEKNNDAKS